MTFSAPASTSKTCSWNQVKIQAGIIGSDMPGVIGFTATVKNERSYDNFNKSKWWELSYNVINCTIRLLYSLFLYSYIAIEDRHGCYNLV